MTDDLPSKTTVYAALIESGTTPLPCRHCGGDGRRWGTDPCEHCQGSGSQVCEYCNTGDPAIAKWRDSRSDHFLCLPCHEEWQVEETAQLEE